MCNFVFKLRTLKKILIIQTASLGDVILCTPLIEKLFSFYPNAKIDFLLKEGYEGVLRRHPKLHFVIVWDKKEKKYKKLIELIRIIRDNRYDAVINVQRFASSGLITALSAAKWTVGFNKNPFSLFFSKRVKHNIGKKKDGLHEVERNLKLIDDITDAASNFPMRLYPLPHDQAKVSQYKTVQFICLAPASLWFTKQFPEEKWVEFVSAVEESLFIYFLGSPGEKELCDRIIQQSGHKNSLNLAGKLGFLESAALMKDAQMNYVNDSAPMHLASAMDAPVCAIFCSTIPEFGFGPRASRSILVQTQKELTCKPCGLHGLKKCPKGHFDCALSINKKQLLEHL